MDTPYQATPDVHVLPSTLPLPGVGVLTTNAYVVLADEPVLIDTGIAAESADFVEALASIVDPADLRWVWLTHDDADHTGSLERVLDLAPKARLITHGLGALRLGMWCPVPMDRVRALRVGDRIPVGDRTLRAVRPPLFDNPMSTGVLDESTGTLFSVDAFGAILPAAAQHVADIAEDDLAAGMVSWATFDSPWTQIVDRGLYAQALDSVRRLAPAHILSSHLPSAGGTALDQLLGVLAKVPDAEPFVPPDQEGFEAMLAGMAAVTPA